MSDTPRTDALLEGGWESNRGTIISKDALIAHARQLERELNEVNAIAQMHHWKLGQLAKK